MKERKRRTIGLPYSGKRFTSFCAFCAASASGKDTNACPRMRKLLCATTSSTSPYDLNKLFSDCLRTREKRDV